MKKRIERLRDFLKETNLPAVLIVNSEGLSRFSPNIFYLTGLQTTNGWCLVTQDKAHFFTDRRYKEAARKTIKGFDIHCFKKGASVEDYLESIYKILKSFGINALGVETNILTCDLCNKLTEIFKSVEFFEASEALKESRRIKDEEEISKIRWALDITIKAFQDTLPFIKPGVREHEIAAELSYKMRKLGASKDSFPFIVNSGLRSSLIHGEASSKIIKKGDVLQFDIGCVVGGYNSDFSRVVFVSKPKKTRLRQYEVVKEANVLGKRLMKAGVNPASVFNKVNEFITQSGFPKLPHSLGHGLGLEVHDGENIGPFSNDCFKVGEVFTVEPGIYLPNRGIRLEDVVVVGESGIEDLTNFSLDPIVV